MLLLDQVLDNLTSARLYHWKFLYEYFKTKSIQFKASLWLKTTSITISRIILRQLNSIQLGTSRLKSCLSQFSQKLSASTACMLATFSLSAVLCQFCRAKDMSSCSNQQSFITLPEPLKVTENILILVSEFFTNPILMRYSKMEGSNYINFSYSMSTIYGLSKCLSQI